MLTVLKAVLSLADLLAKICHDRQLLDAGQSQAIAENLSNAMDKIQKANAARAHVDPAGVQDDPRNRDRR